MPDIEPALPAADRHGDPRPGEIRADGARYHVRIRDLPATERPRERLHSAGAGALWTWPVGSLRRTG